MKTARLAAHKALLAITVLAVALVLPVNAWASAGSPQICTVGSNCEIGEFLYDDNYAPINSGASCTITSRDPNGASYLSGASMDPSGDSDGWYSYSFTPTTGDVVGQYRTQVCCNVSGQDMCIDKSFEIQTDSTPPSSNDVASAVWGYSGRTLTGFGSLVSDIWTYSTRSLSSFSTLISDIWSNSSRSLTTQDLGDGGKIATQDDTNNISNKVDNINTTNVQNDTTEIKSTVNENRLLLERLVNKPVVETVLQNQPTPNLNSKINETETKREEREL